MKLINRRKSVLPPYSNLEDLPGPSSFPFYMGCVEGKKNEDIFAPMNWGISKENGLIQLKDLIPLNDLYCNSHGSGEVGNLWKKHHSTINLSLF